MNKNFFKNKKFFSILWNEKITYINFIIISSYILITSFINTDIGKQYLTKISFLQNKNATYVLTIGLVFWLLYLFFSKNSLQKNINQESELNYFVLVSLIFIIVELTLLRDVPFTILIYLLILGFIFILFDLNILNSLYMVKSHKLQLVLLTLTVLCIDVNYASDVLANTFSYTNFQRTGDIEEYLFLGNYIIKDGYLIIYKLITLFSFLFFIVFRNNFYEKLQNKTIKKLSYFLILIAIYESLVTTTTQNDYFHNAFTMNEFISVYQNKFPLVNYSATYNNIFPYINKILFSSFSFKLTSILISIISIMSIFIVLGIIKKNSSENKLKNYYYFVGITISSTLLSRPHYSLRFFFVLLFFYFAKELSKKTNFTSKVVFTFLIFISLINNFTFGAPLIITFIVCEVIYFYKGISNLRILLRNIFQFLFILGFLLFIFRFSLGENSLTYLISSTISWGNIFLDFTTNQGLTFHYIAFPLLFYNLSVIFSSFRINNFRENYISLFLTIYSIGLVPYYFNFQEIYHFLPILLFLFLGIATNSKPLSKNIFYVVFIVSIFLTPRLFVGIYETIAEQAKNQVEINFISEKNYEEEFLEIKIKNFSEIIKITNNEVGYILELNNLLSIYTVTKNDSIENMPTNTTFDKMCNDRNLFNKDRYIMEKLFAENLKEYLNINPCDIEMKLLQTSNQNFILIEMTGSK